MALIDDERRPPGLRAEHGIDAEAGAADAQGEFVLGDLIAGVGRRFAGQHLTHLFVQRRIAILLRQEHAEAVRPAARGLDLRGKQGTVSPACTVGGGAIFSERGACRLPA